MSRYYNLTLALLLLVALACQKSDTEQLSYEESSSEGVLSLGYSFASTRSGEVSDKITTNGTLKIYNHPSDSVKNLIRYYKLDSIIPSDIYLAVGDYSVAVEAGVALAATYHSDSLKYSGSESFSIESQSVSDVEVVCTSENVAAKVIFDQTIISNFDKGFYLYFAPTDTLTKGELVTLDNLYFEQDGMGYFHMPDDVSDVAWWFYGESSDEDIAYSGVLDRAGVIEDVESAALYTLSLKYSLSADGYLDFSVSVDDSSVDSDATVTFSPRPTITPLDGLDLSQLYIQTSRSQTLSFGVSALVDISTVTVDAGFTTGETLSPFESEVLVDLSSEGASYQWDSELSGVLTINNRLFESGLWGQGGARDVTISVTDVKGSTQSVVLSCYNSGFTSEPEVDLWLNSGVFSPEIVLDESELSAGLEFRLYDNDADDWGEAIECVKGDDGKYRATVEASWRLVETNDDRRPDVLDAYALNSGIFADNSYRYAIFVKGEDEPLMQDSCTTSSGHSIPYADMESSSLPCFGTSGSSSTSWASGNNTWTSSLCKQGTESNGNNYAYLKSTTFSVLATGNLFFGAFSFSGTSGTAYFGQGFNWESRPRKFRFKCKASVGVIDSGSNYDEVPIEFGEQDRSKIQLVIMDWSARRGVSAGTGDPSGMWDPETATSIDGCGDIIGYASCWIDESTEGDGMVEMEVDILYYDKVTKPSSDYTITINAACSAYGDYKLGCKSNEMWLDDFELVY